MATSVCPYPIAVMSFNRPGLLKEVLTSLKTQTIPLNESRIYLFQDGANSRFTSIAADNSLGNECVRSFLEIFPNGQVLQSAVNLGVALNFDRAERLFFEKLEAECGLFFEDDLVLSPHYLDALLQLVDFALSEPLVSYVGAYGDHTASLERQRFNSKRVIPLIHNWGFAITRRQWLQQNKVVDGYLAIVQENDYQRRDHQRIENYFGSFGFATGCSSQDWAKVVAGLVLGTTRLMCFPCFGHYIGREGLHFTTDLYAREGYATTRLFDGPPPLFDLPTRAQLIDWIDKERKLYGKPLTALPEKSLDNDLSVQTSAADYVQGLYQLLLKRPPDQKGLNTWLDAIRSGYLLSEVAKAFVDSAEFKEKFIATLRSKSVMQPQEFQSDAIYDFTSQSNNKYVYIGNLFPHEKQYESDLFVGLALEKRYAKDIAHDATKSLPFVDNSVIGFQAQDVFEHIEFDKLPSVLDEIFRCMSPRGIFRLSVPDYNSPLLKKRSVYDANGVILCDLAMGGTVTAINGAVNTSFSAGGGSHLWFPTYQNMLALIVSSQIRKCSSIMFHHAWTDAQNYICKDFDQTVMPVMRSPPRDMRAGGKPISIVIDFIK
jgi:hypothetical protein